MKNKTQQLTAIQYKLNSHNKTHPHSLSIYFSENALNLPLLNVYYPHIAHAIRCRLIEILIKNEIIQPIDTIHYDNHWSKYLISQVRWIPEENIIKYCEVSISDGSMIQTHKIDVTELLDSTISETSKLVVHASAYAYEPTVLIKNNMEPWTTIYEMSSLINGLHNRSGVKANRQLIKLMTIERLIHPKKLNENELYDAKQLYDKLAKQIPISSESVEKIYSNYLQTIELHDELLEENLKDRHANSMQRIATDGDVIHAYELITLRHHIVLDTLDIQHNIYHKLIKKYESDALSPQSYTAFEKLLTALEQQQQSIIEEFNKFENFNTALQEYDLLDKHSLIAKAKIIYALQRGLKQTFLYFSQEEYLTRHNSIKQSACLSIIAQCGINFVNVEEDGFKFVDPELIYQQFTLQELAQFANFMMGKFLIGSSRSTTARKIMEKALENEGLNVSEKFVTLNDNVAIDITLTSSETALLTKISNIQISKLEKVDLSMQQLQPISARINSKLRSIKHDLENQYLYAKYANKIEKLSFASEQIDLSNETVKKYLVEAANLRRKIDKLDNHEQLLNACNQIIRRFKKMYHASADFIIKQLKALNDEIEKNFSVLETERGNLLTLLAQAPLSQANLSAFELKLHEWKNLIDAWQRQINRLHVQVNDAKEAFTHSKELKQLAFDHDAHHFHETIASCQHKLVEIKCAQQINTLLSFIKETVENNAFWHQQVTYLGSKYPARNAMQTKRVPYHVAEIGKLLESEQTPSEKLRAIIELVRNIKPRRHRKPATAKLYEQLASIELHNHEDILSFNLEHFVMNLQLILKPTPPQELLKQYGPQSVRPSLAKT